MFDMFALMKLDIRLSAMLCCRTSKLLGAFEFAAARAACISASRRGSLDSTSLFGA
jgi:hypothetical protein